MNDCIGRILLKNPRIVDSLESVRTEFWRKTSLDLILVDGDCTYYKS
jgi:hypothetical protein